MNPINIDESAILAAQRFATSATAHAIGEISHKYKVMCRHGNEWMARRYKYALALLAMGKVTTSTAAFNEACEFFFDQRKKEMQAQGWWPKDWEPYLGPSPKNSEKGERQ